MSWITNRLSERTSWDGGALIGVGLVVLFLGPFAKYAALAAIVWGVLTMLKSEPMFPTLFIVCLRCMKKRLQDKKKQLKTQKNH